MSVQRFKSLLFKATQIQREIEKEQSRRWPDWMRLLKLKKLRLAIKDKLRHFTEKNAGSQSLKGLQPITVGVNKHTKHKYTD